MTEPIEDDLDESAAAVARKGLIDLPRNPEDGVAEDALVEYVATRIAGPDVEEWKRRRARSAIRGLRNHGVTEADGQLSFEGITEKGKPEKWDYEPDRLVLSDDGSVVEQHKAKPRAKGAEAARAMKHAAEAMRQARRRQAEQAAFNQWAIEQLQKGKDYASDISFGAFVAAKRRDEART
jgi:hypothetical protein